MQRRRDIRLQHNNIINTMIGGRYQGEYLPQHFQNIVAP